jgi:hypothetical protein
MKRHNPICKNILIIFVSILIFAISACVDSKYDLNRISDEIEISPSLAVPLETGSLSLDNIIKEISSENVGRFPDDSLLYLTFSQALLSNSASSVMSIPNQSFPQLYLASDITIPAWLLALLGDTVKYKKNLNGTFTVTHNEKIDSIKIKTANLKIQISSSFKLLGLLRIRSNNIKINGQPFARDIPIGNISGTFSTTVPISLNNSAIYLNSTNILPLSFELDLIKSGAGIVAGQNCNISMSFEDLKFSSVFGYLGDYSLLVENGQFDLGNAEDLLGGGELSFADPRLSLLVNNSFGIPVEISLSNVSTYSKKNNVTTPINFIGINPFNIKAPNKTQIGQFVKDTIKINKSNCNIVQAMETSPKTFSYSINAKTNPAGPGSYNFVTDSSAMDVNFEIVVPIWIRAKGFSLRDTVDLNISKDFGDVFDYINYFKFTVDGKNEFPLEVGIQVFFTDSSYVVLDSLFVGNSVLLNPAAVNVNGKVSKAEDFKKSVELSKERLTGIRKTKFAIFRAKLNTSNASAGQYVKFYSYYKLDFKMSVKTNLTINSRKL